MPLTLEALALQLKQTLFRLGRCHRPPVPVEGLTPKEIYVLKVIRTEVLPEEPGIKVTDLSQKLNVSAPMVTQAVNSLARVGLVERAPDPQDRRLVRIQVTAAGDALLAQVSERILADMKALVSHLGEQDTQELIRILSKACEFMADPQP